jgi:hypothetical protein
MSSSLRIVLEALQSEASFAELQIHDKLKDTPGRIKKMQIPEEFKGYLTLHGEGETDGRRKILFSSDEKELRERFYGQRSKISGSYKKN